MEHLPDFAKLETLAKFLETVPEDQFDMRSWKKGYKIGSISCGFAACAIGWAVHAKLFDGLEWGELLSLDGRRNIKYQDKFINFHAAAILFNISMSQAEYFFSPFAYPRHGIMDTWPTRAGIKPKDVAARIRKFIAEEKAKPEVEKLKARILSDIKAGGDGGIIREYDISESLRAAIIAFDKSEVNG